MRWLPVWRQLTLQWAMFVAVLSALGCVSISGRYAVAQSMTPQERLAMCAACHGEDGNSKQQEMPSIAGQPEYYLINQLVLIREGVRPIEVMAPVIKDLKDSEIEALAIHFAGLPAQAGDEKIDPSKVKLGEKLSRQRRCETCHLPLLAGQDQVPRIAKQRIDYLVLSMKALRDDKRRGADSNMTAAVAGLSDADLDALAHFAASK